MSNITLEVSQVSNLPFNGNIVPPSFFRKIRITTKNGSKPDMLGANLLSDILYWYRSSNVHDDNGKIVGIKKKFQGDYLQRTYKQVADLFDICRQTAKRVIDRLVEAGLLRRLIIKKLVLKSGRTINNVMYLVPITDAIAKIMADDEKATPKDEKPVFNGNGSEPSYQDLPHPPINFDPTCTETINTETFPFTTPQISEATTSVNERRDKKPSKKKAKAPTPTTLTASEIDIFDYPLTAVAMEQFQHVVNVSHDQGQSLNLYLSHDKQLTVRPENLDEIESNMSVLQELSFGAEVPQFILDTLINTYNKRLSKRGRAANFAMVAGVGMPDYEGFITGSEMYCDE